MLIVIAAILAVATATFALYVEHYTIKTIEAGALTVEDRAARPPEPTTEYFAPKD